jgi:CRP/FNR family transcriptional regulator
MCRREGKTCASKLTIDQAKILNNHRAEVTFKKGEVLCKQGGIASHVMFIREGLVKVYLEQGKKNLILRIKSGGTYVGLSSMFGQNGFNYSASAFMDTKVCMIDMDAFERFVEENSQFGIEIMKELNKSLKQGYDRLYQLTQKNLHGRLADIIICLSQKVHHKDKFTLQITRRELGELSSMATESVVRILRDFKEEGLLDLKGKTIEIKDVDRLQRISDLG